MIDQAFIFLPDELNALILSPTKPYIAAFKLPKITNHLSKFTIPEYSVAKAILKLEQVHVLGYVHKLSVNNTINIIAGRDLLGKIKSIPS